MKIVKVVYTIHPGFAEQNQANVKKVMADLNEGQYPGINYNCCLGPDNKTFTHTAFFKTDQDQKLLNDLISFKYFQEQLKLNGFESPPKQELMTLVGTSKNIFES